MRTGYLLSLLPLLAPLGISAARGRSSDYTPSPPEDNEEVAEVTIQSFDLSERERQAVFGDTSKLSQFWEVYKLNMIAIIKRLKVTDCHASIAKQLEGRCRSEKDHMELNEAYRSDRELV